jgi:hypothetical protein
VRPPAIPDELIAQKKWAAGEDPLPEFPIQGRRPILIYGSPPRNLRFFIAALGGQVNDRQKKGSWGEETRCPEFPNRGRRPETNNVA